MTWLMKKSAPKPAPPVPRPDPSRHEPEPDKNDVDDQPKRSKGKYMDPGECIDLGSAIRTWLSAYRNRIAGSELPARRARLVVLLRKVAPGAETEKFLADLSL